MDREALAILIAVALVSALVASLVTALILSAVKARVEIVVVRGELQPAYQNLTALNFSCTVRIEDTRVVIRCPELPGWWPCCCPCWKPCVCPLNITVPRP